MKHNTEFWWDSKFGHYATCAPCEWASKLYPTESEAREAVVRHHLADWRHDG